MRLWRSVIRVATVVALSALPACSADSDVSTSDLSAGEYCRGYAQQICGSLAECCSLSLQDCVAGQVASCNESAENSQRKHLRFNASAGQACVDAIPAGFDGCSLRSPEHPSAMRAAVACAGVFTASLEPGASCDLDAACLGSATQAGICGADGRCTQVARLELGAPCAASSSGACNSGTYCSGTCQPLKAAGESCAAATECATRRCQENQCAASSLSAVCAALSQSG
jgi:hypothetical protein